MTTVAVAGALGRMGRAACVAVAAQPDLSLAGGIAREHVGEALAPLLGVSGDAGRIAESVEALCLVAKPDVLVDFTVYPATVAIANAAVDAGIATVVGATGWTAAELDSLRERCERTGTPACVVPNFALGAALMMRFAEQAAALFPTVEIIELHHDQKRDAPSGTARLSAERITRAGGPAAVPIHSVRLRGLVAHQEILFGGTGEVLTIRHDSLSRESFMGGVLLAVRGIGGRKGLTVGLDSFLDSE